MLTFTGSKVAPSGVTATFFVLKTLNIHLQNSVGTIGYLGYISQAAQADGKQPVIDDFVQVNFADFDPNGSLSAALIGIAQAALA